MDKPKREWGMKAWKAFEKEVARYFGGIRRVRVGWGESIGDVIHPKYSIEAKWGCQVPKYLQVKEPVRLVVFTPRPWKHYVIYPSDFKGRLDAWSWAEKGKRRKLRRVGIKGAAFLVNGFKQARRYDPTKQPLVCVKARGMRGFVICEEV